MCCPSSAFPPLRGVMFETVLAQLQFGGSLLLARPFNLQALDRLVEGLLATRREFGALEPQAAELVNGPALDAEGRREMQLRRLRSQAKCAVQGTTFYAELFRRHGLDPQRLDWNDVARLPPTTMEMVRAGGDAFVCRDSLPIFCAMTTGTTGKPAAIWFSEHETNTYMRLAAISLLTTGAAGPEDIVQYSTSARALLGNSCGMGAYTRIGAGVYQTGIVEPEAALARLAETRHLDGKRAQASILQTYPSYLGRLVETGLRLGYRPQDFGLHTIALGGEIVTGGCRARSRALFGPVRFEEAYGMTEPWPCGSIVCDQGHLHYEPLQGLREVLRLGSNEAALPGEAGRLVITPFAPFRETTLLLRYDTEDVVQPLAGPFDCSLRHLPATSNLLGKLRLAVRHGINVDDCDGKGWVFPRQILEALEAVEAVPLPARCGFWAVEGGAAVEVVVREVTLAVQCAVEESLQAQDVPVAELHLTTEPSALRRPLPWRGDLHEESFAG
jgi:phenylacetate-CoA ligase